MTKAGDKIEIGGKSYNVLTSEPAGNGVATMGVVESYIVKLENGRGKEHIADRFLDGSVRITF